MSLPKDKAWFPAKRYGYGWGIPSRWQGWVVYLIFFLGISVGTIFAPSHPIGFIIYSIISSIALIVVCYWKGEQPRWRWGKEDGKSFPDE